MTLKIYGPMDPDPALLEACTANLADKQATILMYERTPPDARPCQHPRRLRFEVVINNTAYAVYQWPDGRIDLSGLPKEI